MNKICQRWVDISERVTLFLYLPKHFFLLLLSGIQHEVGWPWGQMVPDKDNFSKSRSLGPWDFLRQPDLCWKAFSGDLSLFEINKLVSDHRRFSALRRCRYFRYIVHYCMFTDVKTESQSVSLCVTNDLYANNSYLSLSILKPFTEFQAHVSNCLHAMVIQQSGNIKLTSPT